MFGGIGSEAISAVPVRAKTRSISGNFAFSVRLELLLHLRPTGVRLVPGMRSAWIAKSPSFRLGTNSLPRRVASRPRQHARPPRRRSAPPARCAMTRSQRAARSRACAHCISRFSFSATVSPMNSATAAGHEGDRQDHRAQQREHHREGHRVEHLALDAGQREDRQVDDHDDELAEEQRPARLLRRRRTLRGSARRASAAGRAAPAHAPGAARSSRRSPPRRRR